jgi:4-alpha-glucanotransferase
LRAILAEAEGTAHVVAEDLGLVPPFVRTTLTDLAVPGYRVIPWERDQGQHIRDPRTFPALSVASFSTHDTKPFTTWWDDFSPGERQELAGLGRFDPGAEAPERNLALLGLLLDANSTLTLALAQELLGTPERVNTPGTVTGANWTFRLPRPVEDLEADPALRARLDAIRARSQGAGRS